MEERLSKIMAGRGLCSRREADAFIEQGLVFVNGERVTVLGTKVAPDAEITLASGAQQHQQAQVTILLHKPLGVVSGQAEEGYTPAVATISEDTHWRGDRSGIQFNPAHLQGIAVAGRLDIDSTGLLVLTQDGRIARQLIGGEGAVDKEYEVRVQGEITADKIARLQQGLYLDNKKLRPAIIQQEAPNQLRFILREGRKRQIRRMCDLVGLHVVGLRRVRIGKVLLGDLRYGQWRYLERGESFG